MTTNERGWEEEFHEKFQVVPIAYHKCEGWNDKDSMEMDTAYIDPKPMIAFIRQTLTAERAAIVELLREAAEFKEPSNMGGEIVRKTFLAAIALIHSRDEKSNEKI